MDWVVESHCLMSLVHRTRALAPSSVLWPPPAILAQRAPDELEGDEHHQARERVSQRRSRQRVGQRHARGGAGHRQQSDHQRVGAVDVAVPILAVGPDDRTGTIASRDVASA